MSLHESPPPAQEPPDDYEWWQLELFPPPGATRQHHVVLEPYSQRPPGLVFALGILAAVFGGVATLEHRSGLTQQVMGAVVLFAGTAATARAWWIIRTQRRSGPPRLVVSVQPVFIGERFTVRFEQFYRRRCSLQHVALHLRCVEEARWQKGDQRLREQVEIHTRRHLLVPAGEVAPGTRLNGEVELCIPDQAMHSFSAPHNQVRWLLELEIAVAGGEGHREQFPLLVAPRRVGS